MATKVVGNEPNALAVSDDGQILYGGLDGAGTVQRLRLPGLELDITLSPGSHPQFGAYVAGNLKVRPGAARTLAVSRLSRGMSPAETSRLRVYDDAIARPVEAPQLDPQTGLHFYNAVDWDGTGNLLFSSSVYGELHVLTVNSDGVHHQKTLNATFGSTGLLHVARADGRIYHDAGRAVDPMSGRPAGTYATGLGAYSLTSDAASNRVFTLTMNSAISGLDARIDVYDKARFTRQRTYIVAYESGLPSKLIQAGPQHLAVVTAEGMSVVRLAPP